MPSLADPLREYVSTLRANDLIDGAWEKVYLDIADHIDAEHERRMEQCRRETKRAFAKYLRSVTAEYERGHKRKSWEAQQKMKIELDVLQWQQRKEDA